jgi:phosphohistidine phosphatase
VKRLFVLRHAKSDWGQPGLADHDRPLAPRGHRSAALLATHLARAHVSPDVVLCSTARRARETLELVRASLPESTPVYFERRIYGAGVEELIERLQELPDDDGSAMLVGHNPGLEDLVIELVARGEPTLVERVEAKFPTAAFATIDIDADRWTAVHPGTGTLVAFVTPHDLQ